MRRLMVVARCICGRCTGSSGSTRAKKVGAPVVFRSYTIFAPGLVFTIGMTCASKSPYACEADFDGVLGSVRLGGEPR
jgi:hypothetical protein